MLLQENKTKVMKLHMFSGVPEVMVFTFSVDTLAMRSRGLIRSASMKRSFFPGSCVKQRNSILNIFLRLSLDTVPQAQWVDQNINLITTFCKCPTYRRKWCICYGVFSTVKPVFRTTLNWQLLIRQSLAAVGSYLFQQVDELISGQPLEQREVRELRGISPGTVSHTGPRRGRDRPTYPVCTERKHRCNVNIPDIIIIKKLQPTRTERRQSVSVLTDELG